MGYIGRRIQHEYQPININAVPYMMTRAASGSITLMQTLWLQYCGAPSTRAIAARHALRQLAGGGNAECGVRELHQLDRFPAIFRSVDEIPEARAVLNGTGYANCTAAVVANEGANGTGNITFANVWSMWSDLDAGILGDGHVFGPRWL